MGRRRKRRPSHSDSDSDFHDNDDDDFSVVSHKNSQPKKNGTPRQNRKKLTLPKHPKDQKSAFVDVQEQGRRVNEDAVDVYHSEDDSSTNIESRRFQTLLDAVFDKSGEPLAPLPGHLTQHEGQVESMHLETAAQDSPATFNVEKKQQGCFPPRTMSLNKDGINDFNTEDAVNRGDKSEDCQMLLAVVTENKGEKPLAMLSCLTDGVHKGGSYREIKVGIEGGTCSSKQDTQDDLSSEEEQNDQDEDYCIGQNETEDDLCSEEEQDNEDEDYCADDSDGLGRLKRKQKDKKNTTPVASEPKKKDFIVSHAKKVRSMVMYKRKRTVSEDMDKRSMSPAMAIDNGKNSPELSNIEPPKSKLAGHVGECDKENSEFLALKRKPSGRSANVKTMHSSNIMQRFTTTALAGLKNAPSSLSGTRASLKINVQSSGEDISSDSPNAKVLQFQSSLVPHQRVIGLSRRVRPAPLHPYLLKTDK